MAAVYSTKLFEGRDVSSWSYTVPAGFRLVVRDIDVFFGGGVEGGAANFVGTLGQTFAYFPFTGLESSGQHWQGRAVFDPGDEIGLVSGVGVDVTVSGYLLTLP